MRSVRACQHASIWGMGSGRKLFTNHGLHLNGLGKEVLSKQIVSHTYALLDQEKDPPVILSWNSDLRSTNTLHQGKVTNRASTRTKEIPSTKSGDFFMVNTDLKVGNVVTIRLSCQKQKDMNFHKANQPIKSTFPPKCKRVRKESQRSMKSRELLSHLHPDSSHVLYLTEHHLSMNK